MGLRTLVFVCTMVLLLSIVLPGIAAAGGGGSLYSRLGIGDIHPGANARSAGMGYTGIAFATSTTINTLAPATWSKIERARIEGGLTFVGFNSTDGTQTRFLARTDFNGAMMAIPLSTDRGIVAALGFVPYSNVDYAAYTYGTFVSGIDTMDHTISYSGGGGITKGQIGVSFAPLSSLALGLSLNYLFGAIDHSTEITSPSPAYAPGDITESMTLRGLNLTVGFLYDGFGSFSQALGPLSVGVVFTTRATLNTQDRYYYYYQASEIRDTSSESEGELVVPAALGIGLAYKLSDRVVLAADYSGQAWGSSEINGSHPANLRNSTSFGIGAERLPSREPTVTSFFERTAFRVGMYYQETYYTVQGEPINAWGVTVGFGLPVSGDTRLHLALEYGKRGTTNKSLIQDTITRITASLTLSELWFLRPEDE